MHDMIGRIADATGRYPFKIWGFGESIAIEGLLAAGGKHRDIARAHILGWANSPVVLSNDPLAHVAPGVPLLEVIQESPTELLWGRAFELAKLLAETRCGESGAHIHRPDLPGWEHEVWVDCMHLDGPFLSGLGAMTDQPEWTDVAVELLLGHAKVLQDEDNGLFSHGFDDKMGLPNRVMWGRGQGWALLGLVDTLQNVPRNHGGRDELVQRLIRLVVSLAEFETEAGLWPTVIDHPETYREVSVSAYIALGVERAIRYGLVSSDFGSMVDRAWTAVESAISPSGELQGVSDATPVGATVSHYDNRPTGTFPWGQGPALLACINRHRSRIDSADSSQS